MVRRIAFLSLLLIIVTSFAHGQVAPGEWRDQFAYKNVKGLCVTDSKIYVPTEEGFYSYDPISGELAKFSRVNGLSSFGVSAFAVSPNNATIAIGYTDGSIDLVRDGQVTSVTDIKDKNLTGDKSIYNFSWYNGKIFVSTGFGIVLLNPSVPEIKDTYFIGDNGGSIAVYATTIFQDTIYAATTDGLKFASVNDPQLYYYGDWQRAAIPGAGDVFSATSANDAVLYAVEKGQSGLPDKAYSYTEAGGWIGITTAQTQIYSLSVSPFGLCLVGDKGVEMQKDGATQLVNDFGTGSFAPRYAFLSSSELWVADMNNGLVRYRSGDVQTYRPNGPYSNESFRATWNQGVLAISRGGYNDVSESDWNSLVVNIFKDNQWSSIGGNGNDAVQPLFNPNNPSQLYVTGWGSGLSYFKDLEFQITYTDSNSPLKSILPPGPFVRNGGLCFDSKGNLWVNSRAVSNMLSVLKPDGTWVTFPKTTDLNTDRFGKMLFQPETGYLWIVNSKLGLAVYDPGSDPYSSADDRFTSFGMVNSDGVNLSNDILSMAEDSDGKIWLGTQEGVEVIYNPSVVFSQTVTAQQIKVPIEIAGQAGYLLQSDAVSAIAVDGANRKWFGTSRSGAFLQSADGVTQLLAFNTANSPLPSNNILDITIDQQTGEVFFITDHGVVSYRGNAIVGSDDFGKIYAFPNPVRDNFRGVITIAGLMANSTVKITDINGYLIFEGVSLGGEIQWDGKNLNGQRVSTGVYLIFCSDPTGVVTKTSKLLFIH
ncbi:MAG TPA: two-component regulator propeller domain-containing protein [Williamwhitmania sp.]|nr:two-component regulator propeller domain-containing protein [Williamwhitmania sp.]